jgi:hypothetical protein
VSKVKYKGRDLEALSRAELIMLIEYLFNRLEESKKSKVSSLFDEMLGGWRP